MDDKSITPGLQIFMTGPDGTQIQVAGGTQQPTPQSPYSSPLHQEPLSPEASNEEKWLENQAKIRLAISTFLNDNERMPTCEELAVATKLSRRTVYNQLKRTSRNGLTQQEVEQFRMLTAKVFAKVAYLANEGDLQAVKLFFQVYNKLRPKPEERKGDFVAKRDPYYAIEFGRKYLMMNYITDRLDDDEKSAIEQVLKTAMAQAERESEAAAEADPNNAEDAANGTWENNHHSILNEMCKLMKDNARMPSHTELAEATGLSRQTISQHLREFTYHPIYLAEIEQLRNLAPQLITQVANQALEGNVKAGKLFLKLMPDVFPHPIDITHPLNYVMLNEMMLTKEMVAPLGKEYKDVIEEILVKNAKRAGY